MIRTIPLHIFITIPHTTKLIPGMDALKKKFMKRSIYIINILIILMYRNILIFQ